MAVTFPPPHIAPSPHLRTPEQLPGRQQVHQDDSCRPGRHLTASSPPLRSFPFLTLPLPAPPLRTPAQLPARPLVRQDNSCGPFRHIIPLPASPLPSFPPSPHFPLPHPSPPSLPASFPLAPPSPPLHRFLLGNKCVRMTAVALVDTSHASATALAGSGQPPPAQGAAQGSSGQPPSGQGASSWRAGAATGGSFGPRPGSAVGGRDGEAVSGQQQQQLAFKVLTKTYHLHYAR